MKVSYFDNQRNSVGKFILKALDTNLKRAEKLDGNNLDVKLTIDGMEFDFVKVVESLVRNYDQEVNERAAELMKEKLNDDVFKGLSEVANLSQILEDALDRKLNEMWKL